MALIKSKRYPEADTYVGYIHHSTVEYKTARFWGLDSFASRVISDAVEAEMNKVGGRLLEVAIYSENSWWGIIPIYVLTAEFKWYLPGVSLGDSKLIAPAVIVSILWAIAAILAIFAIIYYTNRYYDAVEKYGYAPWYSGIFGGVTLLVIAGAGAFLTIKYLVPYLSKKMEK